MLKYYDLSDLITREQKIKVKFNCGITYLVAYTQESISENQNATVPIFLLDFILQNEHCHITEDIIETRIKNDLQSNCVKTNLRKYFTNFFQVAKFTSTDTEFFYDMYLNRMTRFMEMLVVFELGKEECLRMDFLEYSVLDGFSESFRRFRGNIWACIEYRSGLTCVSRCLSRKINVSRTRGISYFMQ